MEAQLALAEDEVSVEKSLRQIEMAVGLDRGQANDQETLLDVLEDKFSDALLEERVRISDYERQRLFGLIVGDMLGLGPLEVVFDDPSVSAAYVLDTRAIYVQRGSRIVPASAAFDDEEQLNKITRRVFEPLGFWVGEGAGLAAGHLPSGKGVRAVLGPDVSPDGVQLVVSRPPAPTPTLNALVDAEWMPQAVADFLRGSLLARRSVLVAGKQHGGKKTLLSALADSLPDDPLLVVVERVHQLAMRHENAIRLEARPQEGAAYSTEALLRQAPEFLPDWIWLDEVTAEVAGAYAETVARVGLCSTLTLREGGGAPGPRMGTQQALDRLALMAVGTDPGLTAREVERQIAAGLDVLVFMGADTGGAPIVGEVVLLRPEGDGWQAESVYRAQDGPTPALAAASDDLRADVTMFTEQRTAPAGEPGGLVQPIFGADGSVSDATLDEVTIAQGRVVALREADGRPVSAELESEADEIGRLAQTGDGESLLWATMQPDGTRLAVAREPVSVGGVAVSAERFTTKPGGLKRLADLGMLNREAGNALVNAARAGQSILVCGPAGSGRLALILNLLRVLEDAEDWQVNDSLDTSSLAELLGAAGQGKVLAGVDCADGVDPFAALSAWSGEAGPPAATIAGAFSLLVRMGRVDGRQRMILSLETIVAEGDSYRLEPTFRAEPDETGRLRLVRVES
jgi:pilus assembly protein CpaF